MGEINDLGGICLSLFLGIAMITLKLWQLADLALPLVILLAGQVALMFLFSYIVVFNVMGRNYDAAGISSRYLQVCRAQLLTLWQICRQSVKSMSLL